MSTRSASHRLLVAATSTLLAAPLVAQDFTLEQIMSSPFPSELIAAPSGNALAWVQNAEGVRNIWLAQAPGFEGRQLTSYETDDGQAISDVQFALDGGSVIFVRGGAPNRQGEIPNPRSQPDARERAIWMVPIDGGNPVLVAEGNSPAISPDGQVVAYPKGKQVWIARIGEPNQTTERLFEIRGRVGALRWSPDGTSLAFVSNRGDHSFVGVYRRVDRTIRYMDPSVDRDTGPVWSPDGRRLVFLRTPRQSGSVPFTPRRASLPWSIRVANVATGESRLVWRADEGRGSVFRGIVAADQLFWGDGDLIVFPWERDGWTHLYSVSVDGGRPAQLLTPGAFEVEHAVLSHDRSTVIYSSNQDDIDRRHIWQVSVRGEAPRAITSGTGLEWSPVVTAASDVVAFLASDARQPAQAKIKAGSNRARPLASGSLPGDFPSNSLVVPEQVVFSAGDGLQIHGQLFVPPDLRPGERCPAVLFFHGGSRRQMLLGWHYRGYYHNAYALNQYLAANGYVVLSVNYRSGTGYGMEFREALHYGAGGASEFNDVVGAGLYLQSRSDVDPDRIGLWGGSYGGYLTALGLARASSLFAAGVDIHGVHDWNVVIRNFQQSYDPLENQQRARLAFESSPMASVEDWRSPVLLIHGDDDRNVPFSETVDLAEQLRRYGVEFEQLVFPDEVHGFLLHENWIAAYKATADFFDRKLKAGQVAAGGS